MWHVPYRRLRHRLPDWAGAPLKRSAKAHAGSWPLDILKTKPPVTFNFNLAFPETSMDIHRPNHLPPSTSNSASEIKVPWQLASTHIPTISSQWQQKHSRTSLNQIYGYLPQSINLTKWQHHNYSYVNVHHLPSEQNNQYCNLIPGASLRVSSVKTRGFAGYWSAMFRNGGGAALRL